MIFVKSVRVMLIVPPRFLLKSRRKRNEWTNKQTNKRKYRATARFDRQLHTRENLLFSLCMIRHSFSIVAACKKCVEREHYWCDCRCSFSVLKTMAYNCFVFFFLSLSLSFYRHLALCKSKMFLMWNCYYY